MIFSTFVLSLTLAANESRLRELSDSGLAYSRIDVYALVPDALYMNATTIDSVKREAAVRIASQERAYISEFLASTRLESMRPCDAAAASRIHLDKVLLMVELEKDGVIETFASDGAFVFSKDMTKCTRDGGALVRRFDFRDPRQR